jgi:signal peptidase II
VSDKTPIDNTPIIEDKTNGVENVNASTNNNLSIIEWLRSYLILASIAVPIVIFDQWSKFLVRDSLRLGQTWMPLKFLKPYVRIVHWKNTGAAFGIFQKGGGIFTILAIIVVIIIIYYYPRVQKDDWTLKLAMGLQLGGALGNLIDRMIRGHVTDFISVSILPVFNIADASIFIGVLVLIIGVWLSERSLESKNGLGDDEAHGLIQTTEQAEEVPID